MDGINIYDSYFNGILQFLL